MAHRCSVNQVSLGPARGVIVSFVLAALFGAIIDGVFGSGWLLAWDARVAAWFRSYRSPGLTHVMTLVSWLGDPRLLVAASLGLGAALLAFARRREFLIAAAVLAGGAVLHLLLKAAIQRPRPAGAWLAAAHGYSFPSGHTVGAVLFYGLLAYLGAWMATRRAAARYLYIALGYIALGAVIVLAVGMSRVYLGVHFFSDILGGWVVGAFWLSLCLTAACWLRLRSCRP